MRTVAALMLGALLLLHAGCDKQPTAAQSATVPQSQAIPVYRAISSAYARCNDDVKKSADIEHRISMNTSARNEGYHFAGSQANDCKLAGDAILKLGATKLASETENASLETTVQICVSDALEKATSGDAFTHRLSNFDHLTAKDDHPVAGTASDSASDCTTALADFAKVAGIE